MLVDPRGKGWVVTRGDRVGNAESAVDHPTGWRVERIREGEVVFTHEDATRPEQRAPTRVLAMRTHTAPLEELAD